MIVDGAYPAFHRSAFLEDLSDGEIEALAEGMWLLKTVDRKQKAHYVAGFLNERYKDLHPNLLRKLLRRAKRYIAYA